MAAACFRNRSCISCALQLPRRIQITFNGDPIAMCKVGILGHYGKPVPLGKVAYLTVSRTIEVK